MLGWVAVVLALGGVALLGWYGPQSIGGACLVLFALVTITGYVVTRAGVWLGCRPTPHWFGLRAKMLQAARLSVSRPCCVCWLPCPCIRQRQSVPVGQVVDITVYKQTVDFIVRDTGNVRYGGPMTESVGRQCVAAPDQHLATRGMPATCEAVCQGYIAYCNIISFYCCSKDRLTPKDSLFVGARIRHDGPTPANGRPAPPRFTVLQLTRREWLWCMAGSVYRTAAAAQEWLVKWRTQQEQVAAVAEAEGLPPADAVYTMEV